MKMEEKPQGRSLSKREFAEVPHVISQPRIRYAWAAGVAMSRFLDGLKAGVIYGRFCNRCERVLVPPRMFCERCYRTTDRWVELPGTGAVETFSVSYLDTNANRIEEPFLIGVVAFDGAPPHMGVMHRFDEVNPDEIEIGMPVEPVWKPEGERTGAVTDIRYFRPRRGA